MNERVVVTLYTRRDCFLCDKAKAAIRAAESLYRLDLDVLEVDIDTDEELRARYNNDVPVIHVDGREAFRHRVEPRELAEVIRGKATAATSLARETCVPCHGGVPPLVPDEVSALLGELGNGWAVSREGGSEGHLVKDFTFPDFAQALAFTNRVGAIAEAQGHHPDLHLSWGRVRVEIWTHAVSGLTRSDFVLAAKIDQG